MHEETTTAAATGPRRFGPDDDGPMLASEIVEWWTVVYEITNSAAMRPYHHAHVVAHNDIFAVAGLRAVVDDINIIAVIKGRFGPA